jgi:hypothetical protein
MMYLLPKQLSVWWGEKLSYNAKTFYKYESALCEKYKELTGHFPILSANTGVE